ncbi:MAG: threonine--tRNA ligase, partial [Proteobacteria bacterium]|nr:threonine--tRNA ligase [Pseudomonadota bacterium]
MMIRVELPDGSERELPPGASGAVLAERLGAGIARAAVAIEVDGCEVRDLALPLRDGERVRVLTKDDPQALAVLRHSAAHVMADAILRIFPAAQLTIGPVVEDGFYYDIYLPQQKITPADFSRIENEMRVIAKAKHEFVRCVSSHAQASEHYARYRAIDGGHNAFKQELVAGIKERGEELSFYRHGDFIDLCRGPHVPHTGWLKFVKLTKVAGAYWRGDPRKPQLQRVYGTAFFDKKELKEYLRLLEEAKKRDHRVLGKKLDLFSFHEDAPGLPFFHAKGAQLFDQLTGYMRAQLRRRGYIEVKTPLVLSEQLWHTSGHYANYMENMFFTKLKLRDEDDPAKIHDNVCEDRPMAVKPMNCPGHLLIYKTRLRSYNEFPLRIA